MVNPPSPPLYIEDLHVGVRFTTREQLLDEKQIIDFAQQFDPQPFHTDVQAAQASLFGGLVASGWHTAALTMRLMVEAIPFASGLIGVGGECNWPRPARVGDTLHAEVEIIDIRPSKSHPDRGLATVKVNTLNQNGEAVQNLIAKIIVYRRNANQT